MHSTAKLIAISAATFIVGALAFLGVLLWLAHTEFGKTVLRQYFTSTALSEIPSVNPSDIENVSAWPVVATSTTVLVPKAYAGKEYYQAINRVVSDFNTIIILATQLQPLLLAINEQSATGDFTGLLDKVTSAKLIIAQEKIMASKFAQSLSALSAANQSTLDAITKSETQILIAKGQALQSSVSAYFNVLDRLLSGAMPSQALVSETLAYSKVFSNESASFRGGIQPLLDRFAMFIQNTK